MNFQERSFNLLQSGCAFPFVLGGERLTLKQRSLVQGRITASSRFAIGSPVAQRRSLSQATPFSHLPLTLSHSPLPKTISCYSYSSQTNQGRRAYPPQYTRPHHPTHAPSPLHNYKSHCPFNTNPFPSLYTKMQYTGIQSKTSLPLKKINTKGHKTSDKRKKRRKKEKAASTPFAPIERTRTSTLSNLQLFPSFAHRTTAVTHCFAIQVVKVGCPMPPCCPLGLAPKGPKKYDFKKNTRKKKFGTNTPFAEEKAMLPFFFFFGGLV